MIRNIPSLAFLLIPLFFFGRNVHAQEWNLSSPDKKIAIRISNRDKVSYNVSYDKQIVINDSPLGLQRDDQQFNASLKFLEKKQNKIKDPYTLVVGKKLKSDNQANELTLLFENGTKEKINIIFC